MRTTIDLNCDMGESFGPYTIGMDDEVIPLISSANVACGFHAGDPDIMDRTVAMAVKYGVGVGAHPGYGDLAGFGRRIVEMDRKQLVNMLIYQIGALEAFCRKHGTKLTHVKPHGALSNLSDVDEATACNVADAILAVNPELPIFVKPNTKMHQAIQERNLIPVLEVYADRAYNDDLTLVSRKMEGAVITDPNIAADRVVRMISMGKVTTIQGRDVEIEGDTVCVHGDTPSALVMIRTIRKRLKEAGIAILPFHKKGVELW